MKIKSLAPQRSWMKHALFFFILFSFLASQLLTAQSYIINDSFEDDELGAAPAGWIMKYNGTGVANQKVVDAPVKNGICAFQMEGRSSWASEFYKIPDEMPEKVTLEAWVYPEKILSGLTGSIGLGNFTVGTWGTRTSRLQFYGGKISATYYSGSQGAVYEIQDYVPGTWYHVKMEHDLIGRTYKVFINGAQVEGTNGSVTISEFPMAPTIESIHVMLAAGNSGTTKMVFDDIRLYKTIEVVAHYPLDGNANDISIYNNHGIIEEATIAPDRFGKADKAFYFDGINDQIIVADADQLDIQNGEPFSVSLWLKHDGANAAKYFLSKYDESPGSTGAFAFGTGSTDDAYSWFYFVGEGGIENRGTIDLNDDEWHQYVAVYKPGESVSLYIDGQLDLTNNLDFTGNTNNSLDLHIGCGANKAQCYKGWLDDIVIYKSALIQEEINYFYHSQGWKMDIANSDFSIDEYSGLSVRTSWKTLPGADNYLLEVSDQEEGPFTQLYLGDDLSFLHEGLKNGETKYYRLKAIGSSEESEYSQVLSATTNINVGLLAYYPFDGDANDISGNNYHGTVTGALLTEDKDGKANSAYLFDGNDFIDAGDWENGGATTVLFWARQDVLVNWSRIICFGNGAGSDNIIIAANNNSDDLAFRVYDGAALRHYQANDFFVIGSWHFYAVTIDGTGEQKAYRDGIQIGTTGDAGYLPKRIVRTSQFIGKSNWNDGYFKGALDEIRIFGRALAAEEVNTFYSEGISTPVQEDSNYEIMLYPNPVKDKLHVVVPNPNEVILKLFNIAGQCIYSNSSNNQLEVIKMGSLKSGIYVLQVNSAGENRIFKVLKE